MRRLLATLALLLSLSAHAMSASFSVTHADITLTWSDQRLATGSLDLGLGVDAHGLSGGLYWRAAQTANLLGNLVWELRSGHDRNGTRFAAGLRGVIGPVALRAQLAWGDRAAWEPWPLVGASSLPRPQTTTLPWGIDGGLQATWRINRSWSVLIAPELDYRAGAWTGALAASVRRSGWFPDVDVSLQAVLQRPDDPPRHLLGVTLHHVPRRAPSSEAGIWFGDATWGAHGRMSWQGRGALWHLQGALGVSPAGTPSDYLNATVELPTDHGTVVLGGGWGRSGPLAKLSVRVPLSP
jgi:hypothetical protein